MKSQVKGVMTKNKRQEQEPVEVLATRGDHSEGLFVHVLGVNQIQNCQLDNKWHVELGLLSSSS